LQYQFVTVSLYQITVYIMKYVLKLIMLLPLTAFAQQMEVNVFAGISVYQGEMQSSFINFKHMDIGSAVILKYGITDKIFARAGFTFGKIQGSDQTNKNRNISRNLNFKSGLQEFHGGIEYHLFNQERSAITPYGFVGVGVFHFNPYTTATDFVNGIAVNRKLYLQPLGTEGQGLPQYPDRKLYKLTQFCLPYGIGAKWQASESLSFGLEFRHTKTFTDYLDDVSTTYVDETALFNGRGQLAVDYAWQRDLFDGRPYPVNAESINRGDKRNKDWYLFTGLTMGLTINNGGGYGGGFRRRGKFGCPTNVY
jgi:hypothetical protein